MLSVWFLLIMLTCLSSPTGARELLIAGTVNEIVENGFGIVSTPFDNGESGESPIPSPSPEPNQSPTTTDVITSTVNNIIGGTFNNAPTLGSTPASATDSGASPEPSSTITLPIDIGDLRLDQPLLTISRDGNGISLPVNVYQGQGQPFDRPRNLNQPGSIIGNENLPPNFFRVINAAIRRNDILASIFGGIPNEPLQEDPTPSTTSGTTMMPPSPAPQAASPSAIEESPSPPPTTVVSPSTSPSSDLSPPPVVNPSPPPAPMVSPSPTSAFVVNVGGISFPPESPSPPPSFYPSPPLVMSTSPPPAWTMSPTFPPSSDPSPPPATAVSPSPPPSFYPSPLLVVSPSPPPASMMSPTLPPSSDPSPPPPVGVIPSPLPSSDHSPPPATVVIASPPPSSDPSPPPGVSPSPPPTAVASPSPPPSSDPSPPPSSSFSPPPVASPNPPPSTLPSPSPPPVLPPPPPSTTPVPIQLSATEINYFVSKHNEKRFCHGASGVSWSATLASDMEDYLKLCRRGHNSTLLGELSQGENLAYATPARTVTNAIDTAIFGWYDEEVVLHDFNVDAYQSPSGHLTQMVWRSTTEIGCGVITCPADTNIFGRNEEWTLSGCRYTPRGNINSAQYFQDNVYPSTC